MRIVFQFIATLQRRVLWVRTRGLRLPDCAQLGFGRLHAEIVRCFAVLSGGFALLGVVYGDGYFSARNLPGNPLLDAFGQPVTKQISIVRILDGDTVLVSGRFYRDGYFALGSVYDPLPGLRRTLTIQVLDVSQAVSFEAALQVGFDYASGTVDIVLASSITPPPSLEAVSVGWRQRYPDTPWPFTFPFDSFSASQLVTPTRPLGVQVVAEVPGRPTILFRNVQAPPGEPGIFPGSLRWSYYNDGPSGMATRTRAILRVWDASTGTRYSNARVRGASSVALIVRTNVTVETSDPSSIQLVEGNTPPVGVFQIVNGTIQVLDRDGTAMAKGGCQVEVLAGTNLLSSFLLPEAGRFSLPITQVPGSLPLDDIPITVRIWDPNSAASFDAAPLVGVLQTSVRLGGDNLPAAVVQPNKVKLSPPSRPPEILANPRLRISSSPGTHQTLAIQAVGERMRFQWQFNGTGSRWVDLSDGPSFQGTQTATLELNSVTTDQAGRYRVVVGNATGSATNPGTALYVRATGFIHFETSPDFQVGASTRLHPVSDYPGPIHLTVVSGPAVATSLPDGQTQMDPTGAGVLVLRASQLTESPYLTISSDFSFPIRKAHPFLQFQGLPDEAESEGALRLVATSNTGLPITFQVLLGPGRISQSNLLYLDRAGTVVITATLADDADHEGAVIERAVRVVDGPQAVRLAESGSGYQLLFRGDVGRLHVVESSSTLNGAWHEVARPQGSGLDRDTSVVLPPAADSTRFYRVRLK